MSDQVMTSKEAFKTTKQQPGELIREISGKKAPRPSIPDWS